MEDFWTVQMVHGTSYFFNPVPSRKISGAGINEQVRESSVLDVHLVFCASACSVFFATKKHLRT